MSLPGQAKLSGMTGFGRAEGALGAWSWAVEARSVNGRNLDAGDDFNHVPDTEGWYVATNTTEFDVRGAMVDFTRIHGNGARHASILIEVEGDLWVRQGSRHVVMLRPVVELHSFVWNGREHRWHPRLGVAKEHLLPHYLLQWHRRLSATHPLEAL